jgi:hypothetical protein
MRYVFEGEHDEDDPAPRIEITGMDLIEPDYDRQLHELRVALKDAKRLIPQGVAQLDAQLRDARAEQRKLAAQLRVMAGNLDAAEGKRARLVRLITEHWGACQRKDAEALERTNAALIAVAEGDW